MDYVGNLTGCSLSASADHVNATIACTLGSVHFANGSVRRITAHSISVTLSDKPRRVRVYMTGVCPLTAITSNDGLQTIYTDLPGLGGTHIGIGTDDDQNTPRGVYPGGLVVLGHVDIAAKQVTAEATGGSDKPLGTRERATLLNIIGALAGEAKLDLSQHMKAGDQVAAMLADKGITISGRTIGDHLKAVREAMDSRKKD